MLTDLRLTMGVEGKGLQLLPYSCRRKAYVKIAYPSSWSIMRAKARFEPLWALLPQPRPSPTVGTDFCGFDVFERVFLNYSANF